MDNAPVRSTSGV